MTEFIGGLYKKRDQAEAAFEILQKAGFGEDDITMLIRKYIRASEFDNRASTRDVGKSALIGALSLGLVGATLALMVGFGNIPVQGFFPNFEPNQASTIIPLTLITSLISAVTGAILGAAYVLSVSSEKAEITKEGIKRGGILMVVNVDKNQTSKARIMLQESGAVDVENLSSKWDPDIWTEYRGVEKRKTN